MNTNTEVPEGRTHLKKRDKIVEYLEGKWGNVQRGPALLFVVHERIFCPAKPRRGYEY